MWITERLAVMFTSLVIYRQDGENGVEDYRDMLIATIVIPAKAGIQWFLKYIPALAGMTAKQTIPVSPVQAGISRNSSNTPPPLSWIPAFAGMTTGATDASRQPLSSFSFAC